MINVIRKQKGCIANKIIFEEVIADSKNSTIFATLKIN